MRFVRLSEEEKSKVETLFKTSHNSVVRTRCLSLLYSNEQRSIKEVSSLVRLSRRSLERFFNSWDQPLRSIRLYQLELVEVQKSNFQQ